MAKSHKKETNVGLRPCSIVIHKSHSFCIVFVIYLSRIYFRRLSITYIRCLASVPAQTTNFDAFTRNCTLFMAILSNKTIVHYCSLAFFLAQTCVKSEAIEETSRNYFIRSCRETFHNSSFLWGYSWNCNLCIWDECSLSSESPHYSYF